MQSWGFASRFERRTTALHPTRSGVIGLIGAAMGIDKNSPNEAAQLDRLAPLRVTTIMLPRRNRRGVELPIRRLEDYHTVAFTREAGANPSRVVRLTEKARCPINAEDRSSEIKPTRRHYLLDARFGVLLEGSAELLEEIAAALRNPRWGVWLGRKNCLPASPVLAAPVGDEPAVWRQLLQRAGFSGSETMEQFDHVIETDPGTSGSEMINDKPLGYGRHIGERHAPRWIQCVPKSCNEKT
jgi:CRISPR system Cascade subunit CasD